MDEQIYTDDSINFFDKIREFVKQEEDQVLAKFNVIQTLYTEAFLTLQKIDEERTPN